MLKLGMRKKYLLVLVIIAVIGVLGVGLVVINNLNAKPAKVVRQDKKVTSDEINQTAQTKSNVLKQGQFEDGDSIHQAAGSVQIIKTESGPVIAFSEDFSVVNGPDVFVYLSPNKAGEDLGEFASLGRIQSHNGRQVYVLPTDYESYRSVVIWCRAFNTTFAKANLE